MAAEAIYTNARIVARDAVLEGTVCVRGGAFADVQAGRVTRCSAEDWEGDYLIPGLVELHTDNLEKHLMPRPKVRWPEFPAIVAHEGELLGMTQQRQSAEAAGQGGQHALRIQRSIDMLLQRADVGDRQCRKTDDRYAEDEPAESDAGEDEAGEVNRTRHVGSAGGEVPGHEDQAEYADRHVDPEDPVPAQVRREEPAKGRSHDRSDQCRDRQPRHG